MNRIVSFVVSFVKIGLLICGLALLVWLMAALLLAGAIRPPTLDYYYAIDSSLGLFLLVVITGILLLHCLTAVYILAKQRPWLSLTTFFIVLVIAVADRMALSEEHSVSLAESCLQRIRWCEKNERWEWFQNHPPHVWKNDNGVIESEAGTPDEINEFLKKKYASRFNRLVIGIIRFIRFDRDHPPLKLNDTATVTKPTVPAASNQPPSPPR